MEGEVLEIFHQRETSSLVLNPFCKQPGCNVFNVASLMPVFHTSLHLVVAMSFGTTLALEVLLCSEESIKYTAFLEFKYMLRWLIDASAYCTFFLK